MKIQRRRTGYWTRTLFVEIGGSWQWKPQCYRGKLVTVFIWLWVAVGVLRVSLPTLVERAVGCKLGEMAAVEAAMEVRDEC